MVDPDGQESKHLHTYLEISRHQGATWRLTHTITSVQDPKHVHHPWSQVTLSGNTRISSVSDVYLNCRYSNSSTGKYKLIHNKYVYLGDITRISVKYAEIWLNTRIYAKTA